MPGSKPHTTAETARAQELAEALRRAWGFDMRFPAGVRWLAAVIAELKGEATNGQ